MRLADPQCALLGLFAAAGAFQNLEKKNGKIKLLLQRGLRADSRSSVGKVFFLSVFRFVRPLCQSSSTSSSHHCYCCSSFSFFIFFSSTLVFFLGIRSKIFDPIFKTPTDHKFLHFFFISEKERERKCVCVSVCVCARVCV